MGDFHKWKDVENTVRDRIQDDSLLHTILDSKKIKKQTKIFNKKLKYTRGSLNDLKQFLKLKKQVLKTCPDSDETDAESVLNHDEFKKIYSIKKKDSKADLQTFLRMCIKETKFKEYRPKKTVAKSPRRNHQKFDSQTLPKATSKTSETKVNRKDNNLKKTKSKDKIAEDVISNDNQKESDSENVETSRVEYNVEKQNYSDEDAKSENPSDIEVASQVPDTRVDLTDNIAAIERVAISTEISNNNDLLSCEEISQTQNEFEIVLEKDSSDQINDFESMDDLKYDSSHNSLPVTNFSQDKPEIGPTDFDLNIEKSLSHRNLESNGTVGPDSLGSTSNIPQLEMQCENLTNDETEYDNDSIVQMSPQIELADPIHIPQFESKFSTEIIDNDHKSKLKIRTIENYSRGYKICQLMSEANELLKSEELSQECDFLESISQPMDSSIHLIPETEEQLNADELLRGCATSGIQSTQRRRSFNSSFSSFSSQSYDENAKNIIKSQLLMEIEHRLKDSPSPRRNGSTLIRSRKLYGSLHDEDLNSSCGNIDILNETELRLNKSEQVETSLLRNGTKSPDSTATKENFENRSLINDRPIQREAPATVAHEFESTQNNERLSNRKNSESSQKTPRKAPRPRNLKEFVAAENLTQDITEPHFRLKNISNDDEIWIMDVPKNIDPKDLQDKMILLGGKSELTLGNDCYKISSKFSDANNVSCIFSTSKSRREYKILNIGARGNIKIRRRRYADIELQLPNMDQATLTKASTVPFPKNLKIRHPLFGASYEDKI